MAFNQELAGPVSASIERLLDDPDPSVRKQARSTLWSAKVSPAVVDRFLADAKDPKRTHDAIYFGLSTFRDKSVVVVEALSRALEHPDHNVSGRAIWGLGRGVSEEAKPTAADAFLQDFAAGPLVPPATRTRIEALIRELRKRPWR